MDSMVEILLQTAEHAYGTGALLAHQGGSAHAPGGLAGIWAGGTAAVYVQLVAVPDAVTAPACALATKSPSMLGYLDVSNSMPPHHLKQPAMLSAVPARVTITLKYDCKCASS